MKILEVENLGKRFRGRGGVEIRALDSITLSIEEGQTFGLVGGSGSGKTTLALCILRLLNPTSGDIRFMGHDLLAVKGKELQAFRKRMQPVFQDPDSSLNPLFRISQVIEEPLAAHRIGNKRQQHERAEWLGIKVGLKRTDLGRFPRELSGGQRQRVAIARALATQPDFLIADEPVSSLDVTTQAQIMQLLAELKTEFGLTTLFISHDLALVANFCDVVAVILRGQLVEMAGNKEIFQGPLHPFTQTLIEASTCKITDITQTLPEQPGIRPLREVHPGHWAAI